MSTFLELAQAVARESGTISGTAPSSVDGQTGRLAKVVEWTRQAWIDIQNMHAGWLWMRGEFTGTLTAGTSRYTGASFNLSRWAEWIVGVDCISAYAQSIGVSDEGLLLPLDWPTWRGLYVRGTQTANRPSHYTVSPAGELCIGPTPDAAYVLRGEYRKSPQILATNSDTPEMPARFHRLIVDTALLYLGEHDEAPVAMGVALKRKRELLSDLRRDQLQRPSSNPGPMA